MIQLWFVRLSLFHLGVRIILTPESFHLHRHLSGVNKILLCRNMSALQWLSFLSSLLSKNPVLVPFRTSFVNGRPFKCYRATNFFSSWLLVFSLFWEFFGRNFVLWTESVESLLDKFLELLFYSFMSSSSSSLSSYNYRRKRSTQIFHQEEEITSLTLLRLGWKIKVYSVINLYTGVSSGSFSDRDPTTVRHSSGRRSVEPEFHSHRDNRSTVDILRIFSPFQERTCMTWKGTMTRPFFLFSSGDNSRESRSS